MGSFNTSTSTAQFVTQFRSAFRLLNARKSCETARNLPTRTPQGQLVLLLKLPVDRQVLLEFPRSMLSTLNLKLQRLSCKKRRPKQQRSIVMLKVLILKHTRSCWQYKK